MKGLLVIPEDEGCKRKSRNAYAPLLRKIGKKTLSNRNRESEVDYLICKNSMMEKNNSPWFFVRV